MASGSKKVIYAALVGNGLISVTKFGAAIVTGSSAMFSEGIHSLVDTGNQGLLLFGMHRSKKPADEKHPFGYASEIYFWAFVVAILIFAVGSGVSIYEGIQKVLDPHEITDPMINYIVLLLAMLFEGVAWWIAFKEFNTRRGKNSIFKAVLDSKDPTVFTVLFEDTAAILGLFVAFVGIYLSQTLNLPWLDGAASIVIGIILAGTAILLAYETMGLLIGEAADPNIVAAIEELIADSPTVTNLNEIRTLHRGPDDILLAVSLDFDDEMKVGEVQKVIYQLELAIKKRYPVVRRLFIEVQNVKHHVIELEKTRQKRLAETQAPDS